MFGSHTLGSIPALGVFSRFLSLFLDTVLGLHIITGQDVVPLVKPSHHYTAEVYIPEIKISIQSLKVNWGLRGRFMLVGLC